MLSVNDRIDQHKPNWIDNVNKKYERSISKMG